MELVYNDLRYFSVNKGIEADAPLSVRRLAGAGQGAGRLIVPQAVATRMRRNSRW